LEQAQVITLHQLKASTEVWLDPAIDVVQSVREHAPVIAQALVDRQHVVVFEALDNHKQHTDVLYQVWHSWITVSDS
jgi:hypothetical protein